MTTTTELRQRYEAAKTIARAELAMRMAVFPEGHPKRHAKLKEMVDLLRILAWMKDEVKPHCEPEVEPEPQPEQAPLLEVPQPVKYT